MPNMATEVINGQIPEMLAGGDTAPKKPSNKKLTVEKIYQKKSQLEHILLRPDTYIGKISDVLVVCVYLKLNHRITHNNTYSLTLTLQRSLTKSVVIFHISFWTFFLIILTRVCSID
jgi:hypothetical protein